MGGATVPVLEKLRIRKDGKFQKNISILTFEKINFLKKNRFALVDNVTG